MARKGQILKKYTDEEKNKITLEFIDGKGSYNSLAYKYGISTGTLKTWIHKYKKDGIHVTRRRGRIKSSHASEIESLRIENEILKKFQAFLNQQLEKK